MAQAPGSYTNTGASAQTGPVYAAACQTDMGEAAPVMGRGASEWKVRQPPPGAAHHDYTPLLTGRRAYGGPQDDGETGAGS